MLRDWSAVHCSERRGTVLLIAEQCSAFRFFDGMSHLKVDLVPPGPGEWESAAQLQFSAIQTRVSNGSRS